MKESTFLGNSIIRGALRLVLGPETLQRLVEATSTVNGALLRAVLAVALLSASAGCAFHATGLARPTPGGPTLEVIDGTTWRLVVGPDAAPLAALDGHTVTIDGQRVFGTVRVSDWRVDEGLHGMPVWVGPVQRMGAQIGVDDRNSGAFYWVDDAATRTLAAHVGEVVLLEGYVDGPHRVKVLYWRPLDD